MVFRISKIHTNADFTFSNNIVNFYTIKKVYNNKKRCIIPSLTLVTIKKALIHFIIWVLEPLYMQENVAIFLLFSSL